MSSGFPIFDKHLNRLMRAVRLEKVDKVPVILAADAFHARQMKVKLADYLADMVVAAEINLKSMANLGEIDGVEYMTPTALVLGTAGLSEVKLPGRELAEDALWQVEEISPMTEADYDLILSKGWTAFVHDFLPKKLPLVLSDLMKFLQTDFGKVAGAHLRAGIVPVCGVFGGIPFDVLSPARGLATFARDLYRMPDKVQAVMDIMIKEEIERVVGQIRAMPHRPFAAFIGGARSAGEFISPRFSERFVLPYLKQLVEAIDTEGVVPFLHFDSCWDRDLVNLRGLPKNKCILATDHATDIFKAKEALGDMMCIMGDVQGERMISACHPA
ncbi:MAG: methyltransferase, MtaA/CmuA family [Holophagaceae bacterium]|nr:methyltransferase, MtaA/CmuA family [Holophagaceae bacterium]